MPLPVSHTGHLHATMLFKILSSWTVEAPLGFARVSTPQEQELPLRFLIEPLNCGWFVFYLSHLVSALACLFASDNVAS